MAAQEEVRHLLTAVLLEVVTLLLSFLLTYLFQTMMTIAQPPPSPCPTSPSSYPTPRPFSYPLGISVLLVLLFLFEFICLIRAIDKQVEAKKIASELREALDAPVED